MKNPYAMANPSRVLNVEQRKKRKQATALRSRPTLQIVRWLKRPMLAISPAKNRPSVFATPVNSNDTTLIIIITTNTNTSICNM